MEVKESLEILFIILAGFSVAIIIFLLCICLCDRNRQLVRTIFHSMTCGLCAGSERVYPPRANNNNG